MLELDAATPTVTPINPATTSAEATHLLFLLRSHLCRGVELEVDVTSVLLRSYSFISTGSFTRCTFTVSTIARSFMKIGLSHHKKTLSSSLACSSACKLEAHAAPSLPASRS